MGKRGPKAGTKPAHKQASMTFGAKAPPSLEGIREPWYAAWKSAVHATPEQHQAAATALARRDPWDEVRR